MKGSFTEYAPLFLGRFFFCEVSTNGQREVVDNMRLEA